LVLFEQHKVISGDDDGNTDIWSLEVNGTNSYLKTKLLSNEQNELISGSEDKNIKV
jgi:hypothetical protein